MLNMGSSKRRGGPERRQLGQQNERAEGRRVKNQKGRIREMANETERKRVKSYSSSFISSRLPFPFLFPPTFNPLPPSGACRSSSHLPICLLTFTCPCFPSHTPSPDLPPHTDPGFQPHADQAAAVKSRYYRFCSMLLVKKTMKGRSE